MAAAWPLSGLARFAAVATARKTITEPRPALHRVQCFRPAIDRIDFAFHNIGVRTSNPHGAAPAGRFSERKMLFCGPFALERRLSSRIAWQPRADQGRPGDRRCGMNSFPTTHAVCPFSYLLYGSRLLSSGWYMVRPDRRLDRAASVKPILEPHAAGWFSRSVMNKRRKWSIDRLFGSLAS